MKSVFSCDLSSTLASRSHRHTIFFFGKNGLSSADCYRAIDAHYSKNPISDDVTLIGVSGQESIFQAALAEQRFVSRIRQTPAGQGLGRPRVLIINYDGSVDALSGENYDQRNPAEKALCESIQQGGATAIFHNHHGMLEASESHHYVKPSLRHTNRFIRSGSVLVNGVEIDFLCIWLLPLLTSGIKHIYTDSSTINSVAYALVLLRNRLAPEQERVIPTIQSFESYKGLNQDTFSDREQSIVLVSASSGGSMMQDLVTKYRIEPSRLCTLYYLGDILPVGHILCDLTKSDRNPEGYVPAIVTKSGDRGSFSLHSLPIHILAEAFVPENPVVEAVQVTISDIPKWWTSFKSSFIGREAIRCFAVNPAEVDMSKPPKQPIVIEVDKALRLQTPFATKLEQILRTGVPATLETLIIFEDPGSKVVAGRLEKMLLNGSKKKKTKAFQDISALNYARKNGEGFDVNDKDIASCCVVCASLADGSRLLDIAQILRNRQLNHAICFILGLVTSPSEKDFREFKSNLCYSQSGVAYAFHVVESIELPRVFRGEPTPWDDELRFWTEHLSSLLKGSKTLRQKIESRIIQLLNPEGGKGFIHEAFMSSGPPLRLRPNSVFTEGLPQSLPFSQGDVFLAATAVLHHMRTRKSSVVRLEQHPHKRTVIAPAIFYRFSDGAIQAAFLRAATANELDYRMDRNLSKLTGDVLIGIFQEPKNPRAEAVTEMLYAIASGKLRLLSEDLNAFLSCIEPRLAGKHFELESFLCRIIRKKFP